MSGSLHRLARWASQLAFADIPDTVIEAAKGQVFSMLASVHAGYASDLGEPIREAFREACGSGAHAMPAGIATSASHAAFLMASWSMVLDFDDIMLGGHTGHSSVLVPFAYVQAERGNGKDLLVAQIAANEVAARVNMAVALGSVRGQMAAHVHLLGAAVARARLEGLDADRLAQALGFALAQPPRVLYPGFLGSDAKVLCASWPIRMGLESVDAVKAGLRGNVSILDEPHGFLDSLAKVPVRGFLDGLGERWHTATNSIKRYPACGYLNAVLDATMALVEEHDLAADAVESVDVRASIFALGMDAHSSPYLAGTDSRISTLTFSTPYAVACVLLDRNLTAEHLRRERIRDPRIWELARRVRMRHDMRHTIASVVADIPIGAAFKLARRLGGLRYVLGMGGVPLLGKLLLTRPIGLLRLLGAVARASGRSDRLDFNRATKALSGGVRIRTRDGRTFDRDVMIPRGFAGSADPRELVRLAREKYCTEASRVIGASRAAQAAALIDRLDELDPPDVQRLVQLNCQVALHREAGGAACAGA